MSPGPEKTARPQGGWWQTAGAVAWGFFGVRRGADWEQDLRKLHPAQLIAGALVGAAVFIAVLVLLVRWVVGSGVAV